MHDPLPRTGYALIASKATKFSNNKALLPSGLSISRGVRLVTSEWGLPPQFENGILPEDLLASRYGHHIHFWELRARRNVQTIDLGAHHQMLLEVRPAHDPVRECG